MANGRALPSALLFDWLLGRAWNMAMASYANAENFSSRNIGGGGSSESGVSAGGGAPSLPACGHADYQPPPQWRADDLRGASPFSGLSQDRHRDFADIKKPPSTGWGLLR